jgi:hypothetical protein
MRIGSSLQSQGRRPIRASASQVAVVPSTEPPQRKEICCRNMLVGVRANHLATTGQIKFDSFRSDGQLISTRELSPRSLTAGLPRACIKLECSRILEIIGAAPKRWIPPSELVSNILHHGAVLRRRRMGRCPC